MNLNDIAEINPKTDVSNLDDDALVSFIPMSDVTDDGRWIGSDIQPMSSVRHGYTAFAENDVLFAKITPCMENGKGARVTNLSNGVGFGSTEYHVLRARSAEEGEYVFQWSKFSELRGLAANAMTGSAGQQRVPADFLRMHPIFAHEARERVKVGEILRNLDCAIEQTQALLAKYQRIKTGLMHHLLTRGLDTHGQLRDASVHRFKSSVLGPIPESWDVKRLAQCTQYPITYGIVQAGPHVPGGVPYIRTGDMNGDELVRDSMLCTSTQVASHFRRSEVRAGEIVCAIRAIVGKVLPVPNNLDGANLTQGTARISPNRSTHGGFLLWSMRAHRTQQEISLQSKGTTFAEITLTELRRIPMAMPLDFSEQVRIAQIIDTSDDVLRRSLGRLANLKRTKSGLMHDLLNGRVSVTPLLANPKARISL